MSHSSKKLVILASGTGSNAEKIISYFKNRSDIKVCAVLSNNKNAKVLPMAESHGIPTVAFDREAFYHSEQVLDQLKTISPDLIVLAGFLWMIPENMLQAFPDKIINIHPALLPKFGGKGMYGNRVHRAVLAAGEKETGISIHYVNAHYDDGKLIAQFKTTLSADDDLDSVLVKIRQLEHGNYARVIDNLLENNHG